MSQYLSSGNEINRPSYGAHFAGNAGWSEISFLFDPILDWSARPNPLNGQTEFILGKKIAAQAVVGSIMLAFRRLKNLEAGRLSPAAMRFIAFTPIVRFPYVPSGWAFYERFVNIH